MRDASETPSSPPDAATNARTSSGVLLCGSCVRLGHCRLGVQSEQLTGDGSVAYELFCPSDHEGGPGVAHGGWTAAALDELLGHTPVMHGQLTVTATITVQYIKPVPIDRPLLGRSRVDRIEGRKWYLSGEIVLASSGAPLATASGLWIARDRDSHFGGFQQWLSDQEQHPQS